MRAAVLGSGSWGTTFAKVLCDAGTDTVLWTRRAQLAQIMSSTRQNPDYLPGVSLPRELQITSDAAQALTGAQLVAMAVPSQQLRQNLVLWAPALATLPPDACLVSLMKGVELGTLRRMSQVIVEVTGISADRVAVVSGPNLAGEIARAQPTATLVACTDRRRAELLQAACAAPYFRPYTSADVIGAELAGAVKNVIALACGMAAGLGFGANTLASLMTRGLAETTRLGVALGADEATFAGLAGMGDLVATCMSPLSRNRAFGVRLGLGDTFAVASSGTHGQVAEGVQSCRAIVELAGQCGVDVPITRVVESVCHARARPGDAVSLLMGRSPKGE